MTDMRFTFFLLCLLSGMLTSAHAFPPAPALAAKHYALYDASSSQMLVSEAAHEHIAPGSLTKLMTAYVVFGAIERGDLSASQRLAPTPYALRLQNEETRMFLEADKEVTVEVLLRGLIVQSANDAARVLAEAVAHHEIAFADRMNSEAQRLGLRDTHFTNATGEADAQHYSSAHDLALIAAALVRDFPGFYSLYALREYSYNGINQFNRNRLLWLDPHVDGMQTAYSEALGYSLAASALRAPRRLIAVVIGADKEILRTSETQRLLNHGFREYESLKPYQKQQAVRSIPVWKGTQDQLDIGFREDRYVTIPAGQRERLSARLETMQPLLAPVNAGQQVGTLHLSLNGQPFLDLPVVALQSVPLANVFSRGVDAIRLLFQ
jgi:D-alanyl-D-alanine carboxypeptidase (penicillin-binding protein 5/6)